MLRKFFASFVVFLFIIFAVPFTLMTQLYQTLSDEDFYERELVDYSYDVFIEKFPERIDLEEFPNVTQEEFVELIEAVFQPDDLRFIVEDVVEQVKDIENVEGILEIKVPLSQLSEKREVMAKELTAFLYKKLPGCENGEVFTSMAEMKDFQCIPEGVAKIDFQNRIALELDTKVFAKLPGQYILTLELPRDFEDRNLVKTVDGIFTIFIIIGLSWLALLLGILALIIRKPWKRVMKWEFGTIFLAFIIYTILNMIFKAFGGVHGIASYNIDMADQKNFGFDFGMRLIDFVLDKSFANVWILIVGALSAILCFVFAFWAADGSLSKQNK